MHERNATGTQFGRRLENVLCLKGEEKGNVYLNADNGYKISCDAPAEQEPSNKNYASDSFSENKKTSVSIEEEKIITTVGLIQVACSICSEPYVSCKLYCLNTRSHRSS